MSKFNQPIDDWSDEEGQMEAKNLATKEGSNGRKAITLKEVLNLVKTQQEERKRAERDCKSPMILLRPIDFMDTEEEPVRLVLPTANQPSVRIGGKDEDEDLMITIMGDVRVVTLINRHVYEKGQNKDNCACLHSDKCLDCQENETKEN